MLTCSNNGLKINKKILKCMISMCFSGLRKQTSNITKECKNYVCIKKVKKKYALFTTIIEEYRSTF